MYIDTKDNDSTGRVCLNAAHADTASSDGNGNNIIETYVPKTITITPGDGLIGGGDLSENRILALDESGVSAGSYGPTANVTGTSGKTITVPQFTVDAYGRITAAVSRTYTTMTVDSAMNSSSTNPVQNKVIKSYIDGKIPDMSGYLPKSAGEAHKLTGALGLTENVMYGTELPATGFDGQLFFLEDDTPSLPLGGVAGDVLIKNSDVDGDASWKELVALPKGGSAGQVLIKNSTTDGDASWSTRLNAINHLGAVGVYSKDDIGTSPNFDDPGVNGLFEVRDSNETTGESGIKPYNAFMPMLSLKTSDNVAMLQLAGNNGLGFFIRGKQSANVTMADTSWKRLWMDGDAVTGAVWNDYAEYRESDCEEFGYVLMENGDDTLSKTTERLSHFAGISSDTWGFSQGETDKAKTPIAVAGRVLAYPYQDRNNYKPGDCVCAAPGGTVDIMTREEVINWPDRIVGTVSCVPDYEEWGGGEGADRPSVKVNNRIWIKVK